MDLNKYICVQDGIIAVIVLLFHDLLNLFSFPVSLWSLKMSFLFVCFKQNAVKYTRLTDLGMNELQIIEISERI